MYSGCQNYRTEPGVHKYGKIPYLCTPPGSDSARSREIYIIIKRGPGNINYRTKMENVRKIGENRIVEQQRSDKNYRTTKKNRSKFSFFFHTFRGKQNYRTTGYGK